ncbi:hypothetical protein B0T18DRAFT_390143 [Schizothecium vesticola]|uniref:WSC domain-containing protein n=1 Tax=Schizothecium vesticola TaxID=314040 RepID=A0AA40EUC3_9PEZI|nr:hypothetical protein B0T18DRAFT_390143 [Schizothecium vesticola]
MTVEKYAIFCGRNRYFGLEYGRECYCEDIQIASPTASVSECSFACSGNSNQKCGVGNRQNLYINLIHDPRKPATLSAPYLGCFVDEGPRALPNNPVAADDMTAQKSRSEWIGFNPPPRHAAPPALPPLPDLGPDRRPRPRRRRRHLVLPEVHKTIQAATHHVHPHLANWPARFLMGFVLAPVFETGDCAFFAKLTGVLRAPVPPPPARSGGFFSSRTVLHQLVTHLCTVSLALTCIGAVKAVKMQYAPTRGPVVLELPVFVVGFTLYGLCRLVLETVTVGLRAGRTCLTVAVTDSLTFAVFPYIGPLWIEYWETVVDPGKEWLWVAEGLNIGFFFSSFPFFSRS